MSTLVFSEPVSGVEMACQADVYRETPDKMSDGHTSYNFTNVGQYLPSTEAGQTETNGSLLSLSSDPSYALHTLVDMALALEESSTRRTDHTYALKNLCRTLPTEDTDNVSSEKDHTYASNTIGFRYSNHRGTQAQPRKSVSEESLLVKSTLESASRKCTSAEEFTSLDQLQINSISSQHFHTTGSNSATLPRSKNKMRTGEGSSYCLDAPPCSEDMNTSVTVKDDSMDLPAKGDHTYAKFGTIVKCLNSSDHVSDVQLLSTSAPGKIECIGLDTVPQTGASDHTYDKLSSAKLKDIQHKFQVYRSSIITPNEDISSHQTIVRKIPDETEIQSNFTLNSNVMEWQPQEHMQNFEKRFLPMDHTYTAVS